MRFKIILGLLFFNLLLCNAVLSQQDIRVLDYKQLEPHLHLKNNSLNVVNFWATWCKPCVEELPAFQKLADEYNDDNVNILLVSLDFPSQLESRLIPFLNKNNIDLEVVILDDPDQNTWIDNIHSTWTGSIPATLVYDTNSREFYEKSFTYNELKSIVERKTQ